VTLHHRREPVRPGARRQHEALATLATLIGSGEQVCQFAGTGHCGSSRSDGNEAGLGRADGGQPLSPEADSADTIKLGDADSSGMLALAQLTQSGPFLAHTHRNGPVRRHTHR